MKKTLSVLLMLLMVISIIPFALAEDNETQEDIGDSANESIGDVADDTAEEIEAGDGPQLEEEDPTQDTIDDNVNETADDVNETEESGDETQDQPDVEDDQDDIETSNETQSEIRSMNNGIGAQVRLLQLEKSITRNILAGQEIIAIVNENGGNSSALEAIIAELNAVKEEVSALDPSAEDAVQAFVDLKKEAIDLSKEFRDSARGLLSKEDAEALRTRLKEMNKEELNSLGEEIKNKIREFNVEQLRKTYDLLGIEDQSMLDQLESGNATIKQVKDQIQERIKSMTKEEKKEAFAELKEAGVKKAVAIKEAIEKFRLNQLSREEERITARLAKSENMKNETNRERLQERLNARLEKVNSEQEGIEQKAQERKEKIDGLKEKNGKGGKQ